MEATIPASPQRPQVEIACLEMELDHSDHEYSDHEDTTPLTYHNNTNGGHAMPAPFVNLAQGLVEYIKLWVSLYPRTSWGLGGFMALLLLIVWSPLSYSHKQVDMTRNHLERDYASMKNSESLYSYTYI